MVNYSSVEWLAQSSSSSSRAVGAQRVPEGDSGAARRPHVPCMVQPAPPTLGKSHLQTKPPKPAEEQPQEARQEQGSCPSSPSYSKTSDYSSGDENKSASPSTSSRAQVRRGRTKFTTEQVAKLEKIFHKYKYVDIVRRVKTAKKLGLKETQVRTWFQNRRMRMKRSLQETLDTEISLRPIQRLVPVQFLSRRPYGPMDQMLCQMQMPQMSVWSQLLQLPHPYYRPAPNCLR
uniref:Ventral homeobox n=1 Tax=Salarias fasciatus TaxID=181472 RepID=A0A672HGC1_SALFA